MDVLDKYKDAWKNQPEQVENISRFDIQKLVQKKSISIVKWIFIIGILEFVFWGILNFIVPHEKAFSLYDKLGVLSLLKGFIILHYIIIIVFLYLFYKNYNRISVTDKTHSLLKNILKTRKTVKYYVLYNIVGSAVFMIILNLLIVNNPNGIEVFFSEQNINIPKEKLLSFFIISQSIIVAIFLLLFLVFYQILYGFLLRKLKRNYKELTKLEKV